MRKLLLPVDGSENAQRALDYAASLAGVIRPLTIHLLYVVEDEPYERTHAFHSDEELQRPARERGEAVIAEAAARLAPSGAQVVPEIITGEDIAETIVSRAEALGCDGIVMGMKEQHLLADLLLGATTITVLRTAKIPLTLVK